MAKNVVLENIKKLKDKVSEFAPNLSERKKQQASDRQDLIKVSTQLSFTQRIVNANIENLTEVSSDNTEVSKQVSDLLKSANKDKSDIVKIQDKLAKGQSVSRREAAKLVKELESTAGSLTNVGASLKIPLNELVDEFKTLLDDNRVDMDNRRDVFDQLVKFVDDQVDQDKVNSQALQELKKINSEELNFTKDQNKKLNKLFTDLADDTTNVKINSTLDNLNDSFKSSVLTQQELNDTLNKQDGSGESLKDRFLSSGLVEDTKKGFLQLGLESVGLGALTDLAPGVISAAAPLGGKLLGGAGRLGLAGARGAGRLAAGGARAAATVGKAGASAAVAGAGKVAGSLTKLLPAVASLAGPLAAVAAAATAGFAAGSLIVKGLEKLGINVGAGGEKLGGTLEKAAASDGLIGDLAQSLGFKSEKSEEAQKTLTKGKTKQLIKKAKRFGVSLKEFMELRKEAQAQGIPVAKLIREKQKTGEPIVASRGTVSEKPKQVDPRAFNLSLDRVKKDAENNRKRLEQQNKAPEKQIMPINVQNNTVDSRRDSIDDLGLMALNASVLD